ncbi:hypothetical protein BV25DRAFT_1775438, partial [Artomyces pyxidatus]
DIARLRIRNRWINDTVLNECAVLLYEACNGPHRERCAIFTSHDLRLVDRDADEAEFWRRAKCTEYWKRDGVLQFIGTLVQVARMRGLQVEFDSSPWKACVVPSQALQKNTYDCGVWVLATIAAVIRGFDLVDLSEIDIRRFRSFLLT